MSSMQSFKSSSFTDKAAELRQTENESSTIIYRLKDMGKKETRIIQSITITSRPLLKIRKWNQLSQFR